MMPYILLIVHAVPCAIPDSLPDDHVARSTDLVYVDGLSRDKINPVVLHCAILFLPLAELQQHCETTRVRRERRQTFPTSLVVAPGIGHPMSYRLHGKTQAKVPSSRGGSKQVKHSDRLIRKQRLEGFFTLFEWFFISHRTANWSADDRCQVRPP